jgi:hypothetical protein
MSGVVRHPDFDPVAARLTLNRWIAGELVRTRDAVTTGIEEHRYNDAAAALYGFVWHVFCDWYLELTKPILAGDDEAAGAETRHVTAWVLDQILLLLHPFMPFLTEELWQRTGEAGPARDSALILAPWPVYEGLGDAQAEAEINWIIEFVSSVRSVRSEMNVPASARIPCVLAGANAETRRRASHWQAEIARLARLESLTFVDQVPEGAPRSCSARPRWPCRSPASSISPPSAPASKRNSSARRRTSPPSTPASATRAFSPRRPKTWSRKPATAAANWSPASPASPRPSPASRPRSRGHTPPVSSPLWGGAGGGASRSTRKRGRRKASQQARKTWIYHSSHNPAGP